MDYEFLDTLIARPPLSVQDRVIQKLAMEIRELHGYILRTERVTRELDLTFLAIAEEVSSLRQIVDSGKPGAVSTNAKVGEHR